ncbi:hypothetical protein LOTGIDRAFT_235674 [Lottia gigantea]|uniref:Uncharacterized protein n=1 Tax=Lottia gigantea TaxID=225164 RepID=V3ZY39_LOTGI|nr:hypothetical protein LOTGIDRAFT_235674 [Lottia gigantea]ESO85871.1 hypothetical protein LOTGIDRAFT_235674 [Lottia gigantea]
MITSRLMRTLVRSSVCRFQSTTGAGVAESDDVVDSPRPLSDMPGPGGIYRMPYLGLAFMLKPFTNISQQDFHLLLDQLHDKYGEIVRMKVGNGDWVCTADPHDIERIYKSEGKYPKRFGLLMIEHHFNKTKKEKTIAFLQGPKWAELRQHIQRKLVRPKSALYYIDGQASVSRDFVERLKTTKPEDVRDLLFSYSTESIGVVCFNKRMGFMDEEMDPEVADYFENNKQFFTLLNKGITGFPFYKYFETPMYKKVINTYEKTYSFGRKQVEESLEQTKKMKEEGTFDAEEPNFMMSLLAEERLTTDQISGIVLDLLIGGTDSTAKTLEVMLDVLARHPEEQEKLYKEVHQFLGDDGDPTAENLPKMKYLVACCKESMRMNYPVVSGSNRILTEDIILSGYHVPKNTLILLNNRRMVLDRKYASDPDRYIPERWLRDAEGNKNVNIPSVGMIPFSIGVRNCVGRRFAEQEIYLATAKIIQKFKVGLVNPEVKNTITYQTFATLQDPAMLTFTSRR